MAASQRSRAVVGISAILDFCFHGKRSRIKWLNHGNLNYNNVLAVATAGSVLLALTPGMGRADQPSSLVPPQELSEVVAPSANTDLPHDLTSLVPATPALTGFNSISQGFETLAVSTGELVSPLGQELGAWQQIALKAVTYETLTAALEAGLFVTYFGGSVATAGGVFVITFAGSTVIYVANEYAWDYFSPPQVSLTTPERISAKAVTYQGLSILRTFAVGSILGGVTEVYESLAFTVSVITLDTALYGLIEYSFESLFEDQSSPATEAMAAP